MVFQRADVHPLASYSADVTRPLLQAVRRHRTMEEIYGISEIGISVQSLRLHLNINDRILN